jgi:insertion element IS1 protein InsB
MKCGILFKKSQKLWVWLARPADGGEVDRETRRILDFQLGSRGVATLKTLWTRLKQTDPIVVATDHYKAYAKVLHQEIHLQSKAHTHYIEGVNSRIRHYLARFKRKTFCYFKALDMVEASLKLLMNAGKI